jgi:pimeloyl-ACP methyl ester carboxylesterase
MRNLFTILVSLTIPALIAAQTDLKPLDALLSNFEYPFDVQHFETSAQGQTLRMAYMDLRSEKANGKTVILLHGKNFSGAYWETTAKDLSAQGYRVIIPDQIGFGKSTKPQHFQYSFHQLASLTKDLLDSLQIDNVSVLGHSMGGMLAVRFALMFPDYTEKLILLNPIGLEDWKLKVPYQPIEKTYQNELNQDYEKIKKYQSENYYSKQWKAAYDPWVEMLAGWTIGPDKKLIAWNNALTSDMVFTQPVIYEFDQIQAPTLLIIGQLDRTAIGKNLVTPAIANTMGNYPELGKQAASKIKSARLVELPKTGHLPHIQSYSEFIKPLLEFLK